MADQENKPLFKAAPQCTIHDFMAVTGRLVADCMVASQAYQDLYAEKIGPYLYLLERLRKWAKEYEEESVDLMLNSQLTQTDVLYRDGRYKTVFYSVATAQRYHQVILSRVEQDHGEVCLLEREDVLWNFTRILRGWLREKDPTVALANVRQKYAEYLHQIENRRAYLNSIIVRITAAQDELIERLRPHLIVVFKDKVIYLTDPKGN